MNEFMEQLIGDLGPQAVDCIRELLINPATPINAKIQLIDIILERTMGKPEESLKIVTARENVEAAEERIAEIIRQIKAERGEEWN